MKKTLIAFAALSAIAGMAQAQSTVTLYGLLDANVAAEKTNVFKAGVTGTPTAAGSYTSLSQTKVGSGGLNGSRFGFRISEDLGGGLAAVGNLEGGINVDTGSSAQGALFGRQANVGVASKSLGTVTIGRNKTPYYDIHSGVGLRESNFDATGGGTDATSPTSVTKFNPGSTTDTASLLGRGSVTWIGAQARSNNSIRYTSPNVSGFSVSGLYGFGEDKTTTLDATKTYGLSARYGNGPVDAYVAYQSEAIAAAVGVKPALENILVGGSYDLGVAKLGATFNRAKFKDVVRTGFLNSAGATVGVAGGAIDPQKEYGVSVAVPFGATVVEANYGQSKGNTLGTSSGFGVQALYTLSKRTTMYAGYSSVKAYDGLAKIQSAYTGSSIDRNTLFAAGVRHTF